MSATNRWWRDYEEECLAWWGAFVTHPATTAAAQVAFLVARFGGKHNLGQPVCAITPPAYVVSPHRDAIDFAALVAMIGYDA